MTYRKVIDLDYADIVIAAEDHLAKALKRTGKVWVQRVRLDKVLDALFDPDNLVFIVDETFLVYYETGQPWYSDTDVLEEKLVLNLRPGASFSAVTDFLEERARLHQAELIGVGTALAASDAALVRCYTRNGFKQEAITLIKEVTPDVRITIRQEQSPPSGGANRSGH